MTPAPHPPPPPPRLLITAGPTHEPIDAVRYLGNRSSGRLGVALADEGASRAWPTTLLLGPSPALPARPEVELVRFQTAAELEALLKAHAPRCDVLVMGAAVADFRPKAPASDQTKLKRTDAPITLELEPTPDLLANLSQSKRPGQLFVGFALEPSASMLEGARGKLERKGLDLIVANPLETMEAPDIEATILSRGAPGAPIKTRRLAAMPKPDFARELLDTIARILSSETQP